MQPIIVFLYGCFAIGMVTVSAFAEPINADPIALQIHRNQITLAGKQIPLPEGSWVVAGREVVHTPMAPVYSVILFSTNASAVGGFVAIHTNLTPSSLGWGISRDCQKQPGRFAHILEHRNQHYFCVFVQANGYQPDTFATWASAVSFATGNQWHLPEQWRVVGFRIADAQEVIDVRYGFASEGSVAASTTVDPKTAPTVPTVPSTTSKPNPETQALLRWQDSVRYLIERGFANQISNEAPLPQNPNVTTLLPSEIGSRLHRLDELHAQGWITDDAFRTQRTTILRPITVEPDDNVDVRRLGLAKTAVHTVQSTIWMTGINYLFLGNIYLAGGLALAKGVFSPARYYLHEMAWNTWGPRSNPALPVIDFSSGAEQKQNDTQQK